MTTGAGRRNLATMLPDVRLLAASEEAEHLGRHKSQVSRARRDPTHPVHTDPRTQPRQAGARTYFVPVDAIDAWWAAREGKSGPPASLPHTVARLTRDQWKALVRAGAGQPLSPSMTSKLTSAGYYADGGVTPEGRALLDQFAETPESSNA